jgi:lysozyme
MKVDGDCLSLTEGSESCRLTAYPDPVGIWTIGYGHTGPDVYPGLVITPERAVELLRQDMANAEHAVNAYVTAPLTQHQFDALVDFTFNVGAGNFLHSSLLKYLNAKDYTAAQGEFQRWDFANGKKLPGLTARRAAEAALFSKE